jgi:hypothetical protein
LGFILAVHGLLLAFRLAVGNDEGAFYLVADRWTMRLAFVIVSLRFLHDLYGEQKR